MMVFFIERTKKGKDMKNRLMIVMATIAAMMLGCATLQSPEAKVIGKIVLRRAVFELVHNNPTIKAPIALMAATLDVIDDFTPTGLDNALKAVLSDLVLTSRDRRDLRDIKDLIVSGYARVFPSISPHVSDAAAVVSALSDALKDGISEVPASGPSGKGFEVEVNGGVIVIE